jgi:peroxiredoxin Q/BCP
MSRARRIELLTGDATRDATLDLCNVAEARAVVALTDSDTANLEVALGARARNTRVPVVMRVQDEALAGSIARQFEAVESYSTVALAAPAFAALAHSPGTRGRIAFGGVAYDLVERDRTEGPQPPAAEHCIPLGVWRNEGTGRFVPIDAFEEAEPFDRLLFLAPLGRNGSGQRGGTVLEAGTAVPDVGAKDQDGNVVRLRDFKGRKLVVYFYPKADTPGCTAESQAFRDMKDELSAAGAAIVGVSRDDVADQKKFAQKYGLNFPLLADTDSVICDAFGVIVEKNMYGKKSVGIQRSTFLAGPDGTIAKVWPRVSVEGHDKAVLEAVRSL